MFISTCLSVESLYGTFANRLTELLECDNPWANCISVGNAQSILVLPIQ